MVNNKHQTNKQTTGLTPPRKQNNGNNNKKKKKNKNKGTNIEADSGFEIGTEKQ
jgi:hypothetical protein